MKRTCPICKSKLNDPPDRVCFPFCSERCKLVDLGRWLGEEYVIADSSDDPSKPGPN